MSFCAERCVGTKMGGCSRILSLSLRRWSPRVPRCSSAASISTSKLRQPHAAYAHPSEAISGRDGASHSLRCANKSISGACDSIWSASCSLWCNSNSVWRASKSMCGGSKSIWVSVTSLSDARNYFRGANNSMWAPPIRVGVPPNDLVLQFNLGCQ